MFGYILAALFACVAWLQLRLAWRDYHSGISRVRMVLFVDSRGLAISRSDRPRMFAYAVVWNAVIGFAAAAGAIWLLNFAIAWNAS